MADQALLTIRDVYKSFGMNNVLRGVSLTLREGEVLALERDYSLRLRYDDDTEVTLSSGEVSVLP